MKLHSYKRRLDAENIRQAIDFAAANNLDAVELDDGYFAELNSLPPDCESVKFVLEPQNGFPAG